MMGALLAFLGSSASGSLIGGLFALFNRKIDIDAKKLDLAHEVARWGHEVALRDKDIALAQAEAQGRKEVAIIEGDSMVEAARMEAIGQSHAAEKLDASELKAAGKFAPVLVFVSALNKLIRPILTIALAGAAIYINWLFIEAFRTSNVLLSPEQQLDLYTQAAAWIGGQGAAVISYWFVSRGSSGPGRQ
jgi:hypothetical protein